MEHPGIVAVSNSTYEGGDRYKNKPDPISWERSRYNPQFVFVKARDTATEIGCAQCAFRRETKHPGCNDHPCHGGAWLTLEEAAVMRMET